MSPATRARPVRGDFIDIGGRRLRVVMAGAPAAGPLVVLVHGSFGCAADWAVVQRDLAALGVRSLAYDRAGLGHSDPCGSPNDGPAMVADIAALLRARGETAPVVLAGHSLGGLIVRLFAVSHPAQVRGVVLVDAVAPEVTTELPGGARGVRAFGRALRLVSVASRFGVMKTMAHLTGDLIGLTPEASAEKRAIYGLPGHAHWAAQEVAHWPAMSALAAVGGFPPDLPVAVVTAGQTPGRPLKRIQEAAAKASRHGHVEHVAGANHSSILGQRFSGAVVRGVQHVLKP